ncbi:bacterial alpha-L-rhamnosidase-domain-containing protein [Pelagophyceae sp. CCMP2097]|nr:bacterial alpha-L-rhamnosidase-domain-containing protein [Pelagophyceae sp. CCMP2097]
MRLLALFAGAVTGASASDDWTASWLGTNLTAGLFRSPEFTLPTAPFAALRLDVSGLGFSYASVNGAAAAPGEYLTTSAWTRYQQRVAFSSYDVTALARAAGPNVVGVAVGAGWRTQPRDDDSDGADSTTTVCRARLVGVDAAGTEVVVAETDGGWTWAPGPVVASSLYDGEVYDARLEKPGWDAPGFSAGAAWAPAAVVPAAAAPRGAMVSRRAATAVRVGRRVAAVTTWACGGVVVVDFGENLAGVVEVSGFSRPDGAANMTLHCGEILQHAGLPDVENADDQRVYFGNLRAAKQTDVYVFGDAPGPLTYAPRFTYHGLRYCEVSGVPANATFTLLHFHSTDGVSTAVAFDGPDAAVLEGIQRMAAGAQRSNLMTVPTDCPQRDERRGWAGDASLSADSMLLNYPDATGLFQDFLDTIRDELDDSGALPDTMPWACGGRPGDISWTGAYAQILTALWEQRGDGDSAKLHFASAAAHLASITALQAPMGAMPQRYGDWCPPPSTPGDGRGAMPSDGYTSAYSYVKMAQQLAALADVVGDDSAVTLKALAQQLGDEFNAAFYDADLQTYDGGATQTALALALSLGVAPAADVAVVRQHLVDAVHAQGSKVYAGIIGNKVIYDELDAAGAHDLAYDVLTATDYPSYVEGPSRGRRGGVKGIVVATVAGTVKRTVRYGYAVTNALEPATTNLWELPDAPFQGPDMNSRNHHMFSSVSKYVVESVAGAKVWHDAEGCHAELRPARAARLAGATVSRRVGDGELYFKWSAAAAPHRGARDAGAPAFGAGVLAEVRLECHVPRGLATARLVVPARFLVGGAATELRCGETGALILDNAELRAANGTHALAHSSHSFVLRQLAARAASDE